MRTRKVHCARTVGFEPTGTYDQELGKLQRRNLAEYLYASQPTVRRLFATIKELIQRASIPFDHPLMRNSLILSTKL